MYPPDWPKCPVCNEPALDGHITCGKAACNESEQRALLQHGMMTQEDVDTVLRELEQRKEKE